MRSEAPLRSGADKRSEWERAEVKRSAWEAAHASDAVLRLQETDIRRYASPPSDTCYPLEYAYSLLGDVRGKVVVEFGCGSGENTPHLCRRQARVVAFDISADLIGRARRRLAINGMEGQAGFVVASAHDLPYEDESVDVIFGIAILHHLDLDAVAREVGRVLRPGGRAIFQEPVRNSRVLRWARALVPYRGPDVSPFERPLRDEELQAFGSAAGLSSHRSRLFVLPHVQLAGLVPLLRKRIDLCYRVDAALVRHVPRAGRYAAVRVAEWVKHPRNGS